MGGTADNREIPPKDSLALDASTSTNDVKDNVTCKSCGGQSNSFSEYEGCIHLNLVICKECNSFERNKKVSHIQDPVRCCHCPSNSKIPLENGQCFALFSKESTCHDLNQVNPAEDPCTKPPCSQSRRKNEANLGNKEANASEQCNSKMVESSYAGLIKCTLSSVNQSCKKLQRKIKHLKKFHHCTKNVNYIHKKISKIIRTHVSKLIRITDTLPIHMNSFIKENSPNFAQEHAGSDEALPENQNSALNLKGSVEVDTSMMEIIENSSIIPEKTLHTPDRSVEPNLSTQATVEAVNAAYDSSFAPEKALNASDNNSSFMPGKTLRLSDSSLLDYYCSFESNWSTQATVKAGNISDSSITSEKSLHLPDSSSLNFGFCVDPNLSSRTRVEGRSIPDDSSAIHEDTLNHSDSSLLDSDGDFQRNTSTPATIDIDTSSENSFITPEKPLRDENSSHSSNCVSLDGDTNMSVSASVEIEGLLADSATKSVLLHENAPHPSNSSSLDDDQNMDVTVEIEDVVEKSTISESALPHENLLQTSNYSERDSNMSVAVTVEIESSLENSPSKSTSLRGNSLRSPNSSPFDDPNLSAPVIVDIENLTSESALLPKSSLQNSNSSQSNPSVLATIEIGGLLENSSPKSVLLLEHLLNSGGSDQNESAPATVETESMLKNSFTTSKSILCKKKSSQTSTFGDGDLNMSVPATDQIESSFLNSFTTSKSMLPQKKSSRSSNSSSLDVDPNISVPATVEIEGSSKDSPTTSELAFPQKYSSLISNSSGSEPKSDSAKDGSLESSFSTSESAMPQKNSSPTLLDVDPNMSTLVSIEIESTSENSFVVSEKALLRRSSCVSSSSLLDVDCGIDPNLSILAPVEIESSSDNSFLVAEKALPNKKLFHSSSCSLLDFDSTVDTDDLNFENCCHYLNCDDITEFDDDCNYFPNSDCVNEEKELNSVNQNFPGSNCDTNNMNSKGCSSDSLSSNCDSGNDGSSNMINSDYEQSCKPCSLLDINSATEINGLSFKNTCLSDSRSSLNSEKILSDLVSYNESVEQNSSDRSLPILDCMENSLSLENGEPRLDLSTGGEQEFNSERTPPILVPCVFDELILSVSKDSSIYDYEAPYVSEVVEEIALCSPRSIEVDCIPDHLSPRVLVEKLDLGRWGFLDEKSSSPCTTKNMQCQEILPLDILDRKVIDENEISSTSVTNKRVKKIRLPWKMKLKLRSVDNSKKTKKRKAQHYRDTMKRAKKE